mgnify:CR=1 FL=1
MINVIKCFIINNDLCVNRFVIFSKYKQKLRSTQKLSHILRLTSTKWKKCS